MLITVKLTGATLQMNLRNPLHAGDNADKKAPTLALKPRVDITESLQTGVSVAPRKGLVSSKFFFF